MGGIFYDAVPVGGLHCFAEVTGVIKDVYHHGPGSDRYTHVELLSTDRRDGMASQVHKAIAGDCADSVTASEILGREVTVTTEVVRNSRWNPFAGRTFRQTITPVRDDHFLEEMDVPAQPGYVVEMPLGQAKRALKHTADAQTANVKVA